MGTVGGVSTWSELVVGKQDLAGGSGVDKREGCGCMWLMYDSITTKVLTAALINYQLIKSTTGRESDGEEMDDLLFHQSSKALVKNATQGFLLLLKSMTQFRNHDCSK